MPQSHVIARGTVLSTDGRRDLDTERPLPPSPMGGAARDANAALLGASSHAHDPAADNSAEGVRDEEDRRGVHVGHYTPSRRPVKRRAAFM